MIMTRLDRVIEQVMERRKNGNGWIYDDDGNIADNVLIADIIPFLKELKDYEIEVSDEWLEDFLHNSKVKESYTYNWNANVSSDFVMKELETDDEFIVAICVHVGYDARVGFTDYFVCMFSSFHEMYELESITQHKRIDNRHEADLYVFKETYDVYDCENEYLYDSVLGMEVDEVIDWLARQEAN